MSNLDLETVIEDAVNDSIAPDSVEDTPEVSEPTPEVEAPTGDAPSEPSDPPTNDAEPSIEVQSPGFVKDAPAAVKDEFERIAGMPAVGVTGRENRIPYSRVKKITEKAVTDLAEVALGRKLGQGEKAADVVKAHVARIPELEGRVTEYETRLNTVSNFEQVLANEPQRFLQMLSTVPAYKEFFDFVEQAYSTQSASPAVPVAGTPVQAPPVELPAVNMTDAMPEPDEPLSDGTRVYSMDGLKKLLDWNSKQTETRTETRLKTEFDSRMQALEKRYAPMESEWQKQQRIQSTLPIIRAQIAEAKTWPLFNENENEITDLLSKDQNISLEAAYRKIVFPKLVADRNSMRQGIVQEIRNAPVSTSVASRATKPNPPSEGPRDIADIIKDSIVNLPR